MHTEKQAAALECRSAGVVLSQTMTMAVPSPYGGMMSAPALERAMCIGGKCAMWRWIAKPVYGDRGALLHFKQTDRGYCGLAGKPEGDL